MTTDSVERIKQLPLYAELVTKRRHFAWILATLMLVIYYGFILMIAFFPKFLATPLAAGTITTIGIPIGIGVIFAAFVLNAIYVVRANGEFDRLTKAIREDLQ